MSERCEMEKDIAYSVVIPFYNEVGSVEELLRSLGAVMSGLGEPYEVLAINDGSTDGTAEKINEMRNIDPSIIPVSFPHRRGQTACLAEGFRKARGDVIISLDGDLQDDPADIPAMLEAFRQSRADALCGWRIERNDPMHVRLLSRTGNFLQSLFLRVPVHDISGTFRIYKSAAVKKIEMREEGVHRFLPFLLKKAGFKLSEKQIRNKMRKYGQSKYSPKKAFGTVKLFFKLVSGKY